MNTFFAVCVVTFDTWHLAILFDWVQGIMLASQGKVLSPGNEGSMAVVVYVSIYPKSCLICVHMPISGLPSFSIILLVQFYVHAQRPCLRVHRETTGVLKGVVECQRGTSNTLEALSVDLDWSYCTWELVIARDQDLCEGATFYYFLWEIVQDRARSCRTW